MTRRCFFVPEIPSGSQVFDLPRDLSRQLENVLRANLGDSIELLDAGGAAWKCRITGIRRGIVSVAVIAGLDRPDCESPLAVTLGVGIARPDTIDLVVRQATETGVLNLAVFRAARSQYGIGGKQAEKKKARWSKIANEAMCQCGRTRAVKIEVFEDLGHLIANFGGKEWSERYGLKVFALERESSCGLRDLRERSSPDIGRVLALLGPEGGWDKIEKSALVEAGYKPVSLGPRTMRLETAAVALVSLIQLLWGDLS